MGFRLLQRVRSCIHGATPSWLGKHECGALFLVCLGEHEATVWCRYHNIAVTRRSSRDEQIKASIYDVDSDAEGIFYAVTLKDMAPKTVLLEPFPVPSACVATPD